MKVVIPSGQTEVMWIHHRPDSRSDDKTPLQQYSTKRSPSSSCIPVGGTEQWDWTRICVCVYLQNTLCHFEQHTLYTPKKTLNQSLEWIISNNFQSKINKAIPCLVSIQRWKGRVWSSCCQCTQQICTNPMTSCQWMLHTRYMTIHMAMTFAIGLWIVETRILRMLWSRMVLFHWTT